MISSSDDSDAICKICLAPTIPSKLKNMFQNYYEGYSYFQIYEFCVGSHVTDRNNYINYLCDECEKALIKFVDFKIACHLNESMLRNSFGKPKSAMKTVTPIQRIRPNRSATSQKAETPLIINDQKKTPSGKNDTHDQQLINHAMYKRHSAEMTLCTICGESIKKSKLADHLLLHKDTPFDDNRPYVCIKCGKRFKEISNLKAHKEKHMRMARRKARKNQIRKPAALAKRYKCRVCDKAFTHFHLLQKHFNNHNITGKLETGGGDNTKLQSHLATHTPKNEHKCPKCNKSFNTTEALKIHSTIHQGHQKLPCPLCKASFTQFSFLETHVKCKHPLSELSSSSLKLNVKCLQKIQMEKDKILDFSIRA